MMAANDHPMSRRPDAQSDWAAQCTYCGHAMFLHDADPFACSLGSCDCPGPHRVMQKDRSEGTNHG